jgi:hypothetical protein
MFSRKEKQAILLSAAKVRHAVGESQSKKKQSLSGVATKMSLS